LPYAVEAEPKAYVIRRPAAYNAPVVSTMTSCINDVNSEARFGEQTKRAARKPPSLRTAGRRAYAAFALSSDCTPDPKPASQVLHHLLEVRNCEQCYPALAFSFFGFVGRVRSESVDRVESGKFGHVRQVANLRLKIGIGIESRSVSRVVVPFMRAPPLGRRSASGSVSACIRRSFRECWARHIRPATRWPPVRRPVSSGAFRGVRP
jgi:hypothetical protein